MFCSVHWIFANSSYLTIVVYFTRTVNENTPKTLKILYIMTSVPAWSMAETIVVLPDNLHSRLLQRRAAAS